MMDVDFWMRSSASTSNTLHVLSAINSHTVLSLGALAIDNGDDGHMERTGSMSSRFGIDPSVPYESAQIDSSGQSCHYNRTHQPSVIDN